MSTSKKSSSSSTAKTVTKPAVRSVKKKSVLTPATPSTSMVKKATVKKSVSKGTKKTSAKKSAVKKPVAKTSTRKKANVVREAEMLVQIEKQVVPVMTVIEKEVVGGSAKGIETHRKYVLIGTCRNCDHMPMSANKLVTVLSLAIAILSGLLISTSLPLSLELPTMSMENITQWVFSSTSDQSL